MQNTIREIGLQEGIFFRFDNITRTPATINAHRLVRFASRYGKTLAAVEAIFAAYFNGGRDIGDIGTLTVIATELGLQVHEAAKFLSGNEDCECVHHDNLTAHRLGISGVPCFILGDSQAIAGAQEPEVIERLFDAALYDTSGISDFH
jgi:predicted DsbA family dithiol-disulfide isomerase